MLQPGDGMHDLLLDVLRETRRDAVHVIFFGVVTLRLEKNMVARFFREFDDFVLNRRAVPRSLIESHRRRAASGRGCVG